MRQGEECDAKEKADADEEPGLMAVTWRADVTSGAQRGADDYESESNILSQRILVL